MKEQRHKRKETYSLLLISNTGGSSRQFHISLFFFRLLFFLIFLVCGAAGWFAYQYLTGSGKTEALQEKVLAQELLVKQLEGEKEELSKEKQSLEAENEALRMDIEQNESEKEEEEEEEQQSPEEDSAFPSRYPSYGASVLKANYSEDQPYMTISIYEGGNIVAAGDGTVVAVSSDDTYAHIVEMEHTSGYKTRYLCRQEAELKVEEGAQVLRGDTLLTVITDETMLDYQVILNDESVDPLLVIDAKG